MLKTYSLRNKTAATLAAAKHQMTSLAAKNTPPLPTLVAARYRPIWHALARLLVTVAAARGRRRRRRRLLCGFERRCSDGGVSVLNCERRALAPPHQQARRTRRRARARARERNRVLLRDAAATAVGERAPIGHRKQRRNARAPARACRSSSRRASRHRRRRRSMAPLTCNTFDAQSFSNLLFIFACALLKPGCMQISSWDSAPPTTMMKRQRRRARACRSSRSSC